MYISHIHRRTIHTKNSIHTNVDLKGRVANSSKSVWLGKRGLWVWVGTVFPNFFRLCIGCGIVILSCAPRASAVSVSWWKALGMPSVLERAKGHVYLLCRRFSAFLFFTCVSESHLSLGWGRALKSPSATADSISRHLELLSQFRSGNVNVRNLILSTWKRCFKVFIGFHNLGKDRHISAFECLKSDSSTKSYGSLSL